MTRVARVVYPIITVVICISLGVPFLSDHHADWDGTYLASARHLWVGQSVYHNGDGFVYPPFAALFALPFAYLPGVLPKLIWFAVSFVCLVLMARGAWQLAGGPKLSSVNLKEHLAFFLGGLPGVTYAFNCFSHRQTDVLIGFCIIAGCVALTRGRSIVAGTFYAIAAAMKGPALIFLPYLIWRCRPMGAVWMVSVFVALNLAPSLISPKKLPGLLLSEFVRDYVFPKSVKVYPDVWFSESNQSLPGSVTRWATTRWEWDRSTYRQRIPLVHPASTKMLIGILLSAIGILAFGIGTVMGWRPKEITEPNRLGFEFAMMAILMLICSPMAAKAQWGLLMLPGFCLARRCVIRREPIVVFLFIAGVFCWLLSQNWIGTNRVFVGLWHGAVLWNGAIWYVGCGYALVGKVDEGKPSNC